MQLAIIINSVVCVVGAAAGLLFAGASIVSIANMTVPWRGGLIPAALAIPAMFVVSGVGAWIAGGRGATEVAVGLIALPWVYGAAFVLVMLGSFR